MFTSISISKKQNYISKIASGDNISKAMTSEKKIQGTQFKKKKKKKTLKCRGVTGPNASRSQTGSNVGREGQCAQGIAAAPGDRGPCSGPRPV